MASESPGRPLCPAEFLAVLADLRPGVVKGAATSCSTRWHPAASHHQAGTSEKEGQARRLRCAAAKDRRLLRRLRHARAHQALRRTTDVRRRAEGLHDARPRLAAQGHRLPERHPADGPAGSPRLDRPRQRLHPHHVGEHRLAQDQVQRHVPGSPPARFGDEALRPHRRRRAGREPGHHLLHVAPAAHPHAGWRPPRLGRLHLLAQHGHPAHEPRERHPRLRQHDLRPALPRPRTREGSQGGEEDGLTTPSALSLIVLGGQE
jgi:hypothetical protein